VRSDFTPEIGWLETVIQVDLFLSQNLVM